MQVQPYLFYDGRCEEALEFYKSIFDLKVEMLMRNKESPDSPPEGMLAPGSEEKILHCSFTVGNTRVMASDGGCFGNPKFDGFALSLWVETPAECERVFNALSAGGSVSMPLGETFFSPRFGMCADKFGVHWMVIVPKPM